MKEGEGKEEKHCQAPSSFVLGERLGSAQTQGCWAALGSAPFASTGPSRQSHSPECCVRGCRMQDLCFLTCSVPADVAICQRVTLTGDCVSATLCIAVKVTLCRGPAVGLALFFL